MDRRTASGSSGIRTTLHNRTGVRAMKAMNRQNKQSHIYGIFTVSRIVLSIAVFLLVSGLMAAQTPEAAQNFQRFLKSVASPETILLPGTSAALSQFVFRPAGFDSGAEGYGHHFGVALADNVDGKFIRDFAFPTLFRQDVAYVSDHAPATVWRRVGHVLMHSILLDTKDHRL